MPASHRHSLAPAWVAAGLLAGAVAWDLAGQDQALARLAGSAGGFPLRDHWLLHGVLHEGGRRLAWLLAGVLCLAVWWPVGPLARVPRTRRAQLAATTLLATFAVSLAKAASHTSCPWDLAQFGGIARHASHWSSAFDGGPGRCFPAGHATAGFAFAGGYFSFRDTEPRLAWRWLAAAGASGLALGIAQQWRGAHFMSHTLWTAVLCWLVAWGADALWPRGSRMRED